MDGGKLTLFAEGFALLLVGLCLLLPHVFEDEAGDRVVACGGLSHIARLGTAGHRLLALLLALRSVVSFLLAIDVNRDLSHASLHLQ